MRQGVPTIINPYDLFALEEALRLRDELGGEVTVLTMGPPMAEDTLRKALGFGADRAVLLTDRAFAGSDTLATSFALAQAIRKIGENGARRTSCSPASRRSTATPRRSAPASPRRLGLNQLTYVVGDRRRSISAAGDDRRRAPRRRRRAGTDDAAAGADHHAGRHQRDAPRHASPTRCARRAPRS